MITSYRVHRVKGTLIIENKFLGLFIVKSELEPDIVISYRIIYIYVYIYMFVYVCVCVCVCVCVHVRVCVYVNIIYVLVCV